MLLRSPSTFDHDSSIQSYVKSGKARLVKGDALNAADVQRGWESAMEASEGRVDLVLFSVGKLLTPTLFKYPILKLIPRPCRGDPEI